MATILLSAAGGAELGCDRPGHWGHSGPSH